MAKKKTTGAGETAPAKTDVLETFQFEGKTYRMRFPKANIPGIGIRTRLEVCSDEQSQAYLVKNSLDSIVFLVPDLEQ